MDTRNQESNQELRAPSGLQSRRMRRLASRSCHIGGERGAMSVQMLVLLLPVIFGLMGFAIDLGRLYLIRGELMHAAEAMAVAEASQLIGTTQATSNAVTLGQATLDDTNGFGNKYNFGSLIIGGTTDLLQSAVAAPNFYATAAGAIGEDSGSSDAGGADGTTAKYVQVNLSADAPLMFWSLLSLGQSRKTSVAAIAAAGVSAPLCTACGIDPYAIAALEFGRHHRFRLQPGRRLHFRVPVHRRNHAHCAARGYPADSLSDHRPV